MIIVQNISGLDSFSFEIYLTEYLIFSIIFLLKFICILFNLSLKLFRNFILKENQIEDDSIPITIQSPLQQDLIIDSNVKQMIKMKEFEGIKLEKTEVFADTFFVFPS